MHDDDCSFCLSGTWVHCPIPGHPDGHVSVAKDFDAGHKVLIGYKGRTLKGVEYVHFVHQVVNSSAHMESTFGFTYFGFTYCTKSVNAKQFTRAEAESAVLRRNSRWPFEKFVLITLPADMSDKLVEQVVLNELTEHGVC